MNLKHIIIRNHLIKLTDNSQLISYIPDQLWSDYFKNWKTYHAQIIKIAQSTNHDIILGRMITKEDFYAQKSEIYNLYNHLKHQRNDYLSQWKVKRIDHFITQRNFDLSTNQTKIIN